jgi:hypothetical protein
MVVLDRKILQVLVVAAVVVPVVLAVMGLAQLAATVAQEHPHLFLEVVSLMPVAVLELSTTQQTRVRLLVVVELETIRTQQDSQALAAQQIQVAAVDQEVLAALAS